MSKGLVVVFSAPSGAGKSTIVHHLLEKFPQIEFSVSATSRAPRGAEVDGKDYYFFTAEQFEQKIAEDRFVEYEEVYAGTYYGTLKSEIERLWDKGAVIAFDLFLKGRVIIKRLFGERALSVFVMPPSVKVLEERLIARGTDSKESIAKRLAKAEEEIAYSSKFDVVLVNDNLQQAFAQAERIVGEFIESAKREEE
ncbi:MAG: guanylate kinase [Candidatus Egerieousia sp.]|nr:guanylate kinase [Candidatus Egerieousia sp.]